MEVEMWRFEIELAQKRIRLIVYLFVVLSILLSLSMFVSSLTLVKHMKSLIEVIPSMEYIQKIGEKSRALKLQSEKFEASPDKNTALALFRETCSESRTLLAGQLERVKDEYTSENLLKAQLILDSFLSETAGADVNAEKTADKVKIASGSVYSILNDSSNRYDISKTVYESTDVANTQVLISFLIAIFIGGGLFLGMIVFMFYNNRQAEKMDVLVRTSMIDALTGLYNRSYFEQRLTESVNRVQRFLKPLAVILVKVEYPPQLEKSSRASVLKELSKRLVKGTRVYDVNSRYDADIFSSIIHEVGEKETKIVAERLKNAFEKTEIIMHRSRQHGFLSKFFLRNKEHIHRAYVKVLIGAVVSVEGHYGITDLLNKSEEAMAQAEVSKDQIKVLVVKGNEKRAKKTKS